MVVADVAMSAADEDVALTVSTDTALLLLLLL